MKHTLIAFAVLLALAGIGCASVEYADESSEKPAEITDTNPDVSYVGESVLAQDEPCECEKTAVEPKDCETGATILELEGYTVTLPDDLGDFELTDWHKKSRTFTLSSKSSEVWVTADLYGSEYRFFMDIIDAFRPDMWKVTEWGDGYRIEKKNKTPEMQMYGGETFIYLFKINDMFTATFKQVDLTGGSAYDEEVARLVKQTKIKPKN